MAWDNDLANIVNRLSDMERNIENAIAEIQDELDDAKKVAFNEGYEQGYSVRDKEG